MPPLIPALSFLPSAFQLVKGFSQKKKAKDLKPSNFVPPSVESAINMAKADSLRTTAPGYGRTLEKIDAQNANAIDAARKVSSDASTLQASVSESDARRKEILKDIETENQQFQFRSRGDLMKWLGIRGDYEKMSRDSYDAAKSALEGAADQNIFNALTGAVATGITLKGMKENKSQIIGKTGNTLNEFMKSYTGNITPEEQLYLRNVGYTPEAANSSASAQPAKTTFNTGLPNPMRKDWLFKNLTKIKNPFSNN